jgi:hypothetical protein
LRRNSAFCRALGLTTSVRLSGTVKAWCTAFAAVTVDFPHCRVQFTTTRRLRVASTRACAASGWNPNFHVDSLNPIDDVEMGRGDGLNLLAHPPQLGHRELPPRNGRRRSARGPRLPRIATAWSEVSAGPQFAHLRRDGWLVWASFQIGALKEVTITSKPARAIVN